MTSIPSTTEDTSLIASEDEPADVGTTTTTVSTTTTTTVTTNDSVRTSNVSPRETIRRIHQETLDTGSFSLVFKATVQPDETFEFLGGLPPNLDQHTIPTESYYYSSLRRPSARSLPGFHSKDAVFPSPAMQVLADKIYRSDVSIQCTQGESKDQEWQVYYVNACENNPFQAAQQGLLPHEREPIITLVFALNRKAHTWIRSWFPRIEFRECEDKLLHNSQVPALTHRVMHLFLRVAGAKLEPRAFHDMASSLMDYYLERQWFKEALDLAIIQADVAFNTDGGTCRVVGQMERVGETLESVGCFETAAKLYEEIASVFWDKSTEALVARSDLYAFAGLAWKRARTFENAESAFLNALHLLFGEAQQDRLDGICREMVNMYKAWYSSSHAQTELVLHIAILTSLAVLAGVKFPKEELDDTLGFLCRIPGRNVKGKKLAHLFVDPKYATKKKALWMLKTAAADPDSVTTFRNTLRRCAKAGPLGKIEMEIFSYDQSVETPKKEYKSHARECLGQTVSETTIKQGCANCDACKPPSEFRVCACCKEISYCGPECQRADWPKHKPFCKSKKPMAKK